MRAVLLLSGLLLISTGCVSGEEIKSNVTNSNNATVSEATVVSEGNSTVADIVINNTTEAVDPSTIEPTSEPTSVTPSNVTSTSEPPITTSTTVAPTMTPTKPTAAPTKPTEGPTKPTEKPSTIEPPNTTEPPKERHFDGASFVGGIILAVGLMGIVLVVIKFYKARAERNYHTL